MEEHALKKQCCRQNTHCLAHVSWHGCVCFPDLLAFHVETHTFLYKHMWLIFIAPALTSPWQPMPGGGISKNHCFLSGNHQHTQTFFPTYGHICTLLNYFLWCVLSYSLWFHTVVFFVLFFFRSPVCTDAYTIKLTFTFDLH